MYAIGGNGPLSTVEAYDPDRKAKFETFCQQRISGAVMDWLRSLDPRGESPEGVRHEEGRVR